MSVLLSIVLSRGDWKLTLGPSACPAVPLAVRSRPRTLETTKQHHSAVHRMHHLFLEPR